ncbi:pyridoxal-phosphate dependent enzyme [Streptomyces sp. 71268]|uniref:1-aminocyclopropane-1-carboxylate deaminase/D-cysteine desulfhydrase n=1 Tax=Streptomyces sp. 71268 TaxID=3002640 RepID=UPI0023F68859|nr:pyridoxal-phosphate dependent enzyme [Streptomyces sp. 71268]WEV29701.1 pyridoxal-phosphate dependent enzyme [Streptomyces sp. 71268]
MRPALPSPLQAVADARFARRGVRLLLKRDDLIHPDLPGNKWRKLELNLRAAAATGPRPLLTFGGAYSNHLRATAAAGRLLGLATIGVVRGDELADRPLNPVLARCVVDGMRLHFLTRSAYRRKAEPEVREALRARFGDCYVIPEGGSNALAATGCRTLGRELRAALDPADGPHVVGVACGTGGTLAGLAAGLTDHPSIDPTSGLTVDPPINQAVGQPAQWTAEQTPEPATERANARAAGSGPRPRAIGFPVLRGDFLAAEVLALQTEAFGARVGDWELDGRFHCGGYARTTPELDTFAADFADRHGLVLDRVYVAKLLYGLTSLVETGAIAGGSTVTAVITGPAPAP